MALRCCPRQRLGLVRLVFLAALAAPLCAYAKTTRRAIPRPDADVVGEGRLADDMSIFRTFSSDADLESQVLVTDVVSPWSWTTYHSHDAMLTYLTQLARNSSGLCRLQDLSPLSVEGRRLVVLVASNPGSNSTAPADGDDGDTVALPTVNFVWVGNMHGDEVGNRELLLRLAAELCSGGGLGATDPRWAAVLARTVVHIIPTMNPDGFARLSRYNSKGVDLNRNFFTNDFPYAKPDRTAARTLIDGRNPLHQAAYVWSQVGNATLQPEAVAVASYLAATLPELSANLHGGSLVANYAMDACDSLGDIPDCPSADEPLPRLLALAYAAASPPMREHAEEPFVNGTVQGAVWYTVLGSLQDWTYYALDRLQLTLELHEVKRLAASALPALWAANAASMLRLMEISHLGLRARVLDAVTRRPLSANVSVTAPLGVRGTSASAARGGYLYKMMAPGLQYTFVVRPYDPYKPKMLYDDLTLSARLGMRTEDLAAGRGMAGMAVKRLLLAVRKPTKRK